jgi:hypothetical protein
MIGHGWHQFIAVASAPLILCGIGTLLASSFTQVPSHFRQGLLVTGLLLIVPASIIVLFAIPRPEVDDEDESDDSDVDNPGDDESSQ